MKEERKELMEPVMALVFRVLSYDFTIQRKTSVKAPRQFVDLTIGDEPEHIIELKS